MALDSFRHFRIGALRGRDENTLRGDLLGKPQRPAALARSGATGNEDRFHDSPVSLSFNPGTEDWP